MRTFNKRDNKPLLFYTFVLALVLPVHAQQDEGASKDDAVKMVKMGVAAIQTQGAERVYKEISRPAGRYSYQDLYLVVYRLDGMVLAHGASQKMLGKQLINMQDADGKAFIKERMALARKQNSFWHHYKFPNPETKRVEKKSMYCERLAETVVCGGIYD